MSTWLMCSARSDAINEGDGMNPRTRDSLPIEEMALAPGALPLESGSQVHWAQDLSVRKDILVTFVWYDVVAGGGLRSVGERTHPHP